MHYKEDFHNEALHAAEMVTTPPSVATAPVCWMRSSLSPRSTRASAIAGRAKRARVPGSGTAPSHRSAQAAARPPAKSAIVASDATVRTEFHRVHSTR
jgi:hypothetical protein